MITEWLLKKFKMTFWKDLISITSFSKLLTTRKNTSTSLNEKFKISNLTFQNKYSPVAFSVFLGIAQPIRESMSASDKSSNFESAEAMV